MDSTNDKVNVESVIVAYTVTDGAQPLLVVGKKRPGNMPDILNAVEGERATRIWIELISPKK